MKTPEQLKGAIRNIAKEKDMEATNKDMIMDIVNENENFCEMGKKVCKLHLNGFSNAEIAAMTGETEEKIADTIRKMKKVVTL